MAHHDNKAWIVVADGARARLFERMGPWTSIQWVESLNNEDGRLHDGDLVTGGKGEVFQSNAEGQRRGTGPEVSPSEEVKQNFAKALAKMLKNAHEQGHYRRLYLVAAPAFLGQLRQELDKTTAGTLVDSLDKDLSRHPSEEIGQILGDNFD